MNKSQIQSFLNLINGSPLPFQFVTPTRETYENPDFSAAITEGSNNDLDLVINRKRWYNLDKLTQQCYLLHEVGHLKDPHFHWTMNLSESELFAQLWAFKKAKQLNMPLLATKVMQELKSWGIKYQWNTPDRIYIIAYNLAKQRGII